MSRIRTTIDSVTKVVGSTDIISKFSRLKPSGAAAESSNAEKILEKTKIPPPGGASAAPAGPAEGPEITLKEAGEDQRRREEAATSHEKPFVASKRSSSDAEVGVAEPNSAPKAGVPLFHPTASLASNMDETYKTLAQHINAYFGSDVPQPEDGHAGPAPPSDEVEPVPERAAPPQTPAGHMVALSPATELPTGVEAALPPSPADRLHLPVAPPVAGQQQLEPQPTAAAKKSLSHYLSSPRPSVQAFVGSYIAPLVPKFRADAKSVERDKSSTGTPTAGTSAEDGAGERTDREDEKTEQARQARLSQQEKIVARASVDNRTRALVRGLLRVSDTQLLTRRVEELCLHLLEFPETRGVAIKEKALPCLLRLRQARDAPLQAAVREALALSGYTPPVKGRGIRVLAIDGGGTRGLLALQTLYKLQDLTGKRVHQLFDYICGVSTGAILAFMLGIFQMPLEECEEVYRKLGSDVFKQNVIVGTVKMGWSHAFYDSEIWENILKERLGERSMFESARDPHCPKVSAVSTVVNRGLPLKAFVFRNYRLMPGVRSHYLGDCKHKMWQAIRASSAAPGYFQEFVLGKDLHQDGGLLINNPTALAIHECKCLWPSTPLQCVLSLGTGRFETGSKNSATYTSLKTKLSHVISSATDTEEVHTMLDALLPPDTYFRFNPSMSEDVPLNESRQEKLNFLKSEGERYLQRNQAKLRKAASVLGQEKSAIQRLAEWAKLKADMYDGLPLLSKL